jgi:hypothetical protein
VRARASTAAREVLATQGDPAAPYGWAEAVAKQRRIHRAAIAQHALERLATTCRGLAETHALADVFAALPALMPGGR